MMHDIVIISAGKMARVVYSWVSDAIDAGQPWRIKGFLDSRPDILDGFEYDAPILASVDNYTPEPNDRFICAIGEPAPKRAYCEKILAKGGQFATLIHPTVVRGKHLTLGDGVIIGPFCTLDPDLTVGNFVTVLTHTNLSHDSVIGDWCQICGHCGLGGNLEIGEMVFIGMGVSIVPGTRVGAGAYIGAGSVVLKRVPARMKVFGVPAMPIGQVE